MNCGCAASLRPRLKLAESGICDFDGQLASASIPTTDHTCTTTAVLWSAGQGHSPSAGRKGMRNFLGWPLKPDHVIIALRPGAAAPDH